MKADGFLTAFVSGRVRIQEVPLSAGQRGGRETKSFYQIEKLTCEAKAVPPGICGHREA